MHLAFSRRNQTHRSFTTGCSQAGRPMIRRQLGIHNKLGLHARAAAKFVRCAGRFRCQVTVARGDMSVDGKSIMGVLLLAAPLGSMLEVTVDGEDEQAAITAITDLVSGKFGEE